MSVPGDMAGGKRQVAALAGLGAVNLGCSLAQQLYVLTSLGAGPESDAFLGSNTLPSLVGTALAGALSSALVPLFSGAGERQARAGAIRICWVAAGVLAAPALLLWIAADRWVQAAFPGFDPRTLTLAAQLARVQVPAMFLLAFHAAFASFFQARSRFVLPELAAAAGSVLSLFLVALTLPHMGLIPAAWASLARPLVPVLVLAVAIARGTGDPAPPGFVRQVSRQVRPLLLGSLYYRSGALVDGHLSSYAPAGQLSLLFLVERILAACSDLLRRSIAVPAVTALSQATSPGGRDGRHAVFRRYAVRLAFFSGSALLFAVLTAALAVAAAGAWQPRLLDEAKFSFTLLLALSGYFAAATFGHLQAGAWHARGDTRSPAKIGALSFSLGLLLRIAGFWAGGVVGIALGTSIQYLVASMLHAAWDPLLRRRREAQARLRRQRAVGRPPQVL